MRHQRALKDGTTERRRLRRAAVAAASVLVAGVLIGTPVVTGSDPVAHAAGASVYIDEPLQDGDPSIGWELQGDGYYANSNGTQGSAWKPTLTTIKENNQLYHSRNTNNCGVATGVSSGQKCLATYEPSRDSKWLTLTTDNTNSNDTNTNGGAQAGTALHNESFSSSLGVVLEYDQRVYRTNDGRTGGSPAVQGGGDGIAVYLADANPPRYGNGGVDNTPGEAGGPGAGLGYSAVSGSGDGWCPTPPSNLPTQQGVPGGYIGVGFDVYGNYQKAEKSETHDKYNRLTLRLTPDPGH